MLHYFSDQLEEHGVTVLPRPRGLILDAARTDFKAALASFPEFKQPPTDGVFVLGGFAALGNPASFHNPFVRRFREGQLASAIDLVFSHPNYTGYKIEKLFDRMLYRKPGATPSAETWHRDESVGSVPRDLVFGGWTNLSSETEYFSCVPGTHKQQRGELGFARIPSSQHAKYKKKSCKIMIRPGETVLFYEHIVHEVLAAKAKSFRMRVFCGFRLTFEDGSLQPDLQTVFDKQAVPLLKSAQVPRMWAKLHWCNWRDKIKAFSERFVDAAKTKMTVKSGKEKGKEITVVHACLPSLEEMGLNKYPQYTDVERSIYKPCNSHILRPFGTERYKFMHMPVEKEKERIKFRGVFDLCNNMRSGIVVFPSGRLYRHMENPKQRIIINLRESLCLGCNLPVKQPRGLSPSCTVCGFSARPKSV